MKRLTVSLRRKIASLWKAKNRREYGIFVAEGTKCVLDTLPYFSCRYLFATPAWLIEHGSSVPAGPEVLSLSIDDIDMMSQLMDPPPVLAVYDIPEPMAPPVHADGLMVALDRIQDPGNLGTIIRLCDWFGVRHILASADTADVYSPKVVQATMGAIARVQVHYCDLEAELRRYSESVPVYGTFLDGDNLYGRGLDTRRGIIVMGNEGQGISAEVAAVVSERLLIPSYPPDEPTSESLNVATATAIILSEFRRRLSPGS